MGKKKTKMKVKLGLSKKKLQKRLDELALEQFTGNAPLVVDTFRRAVKALGIPVVFGPIVEGKTYDAMLFFREGETVLTLGRSRAVKGVYNIKDEGDVETILDKIIEENQDR